MRGCHAIRYLNVPRMSGGLIFNAGLLASNCAIRPGTVAISSVPITPRIAAAKYGTQIGHRRFCANPSQPFLWNCLDSSQSADADVTCREILLQRQSAREAGLFYCCTRKLILKNNVGGKTRGNIPVVSTQQDIHSISLHLFKRAIVPRNEIEGHLARFGKNGFRKQRT
jgi:hypothetical protein